MNEFPYDGLIFDMDGTITRPVLDFVVIRREIGITGGDLLDEIAALPPPEQERAWAIVERHEEDAITRQELQEGCGELLQDCRNNAIRLGLITRNARKSVDRLCERFGLAFDAVVTREFPHLKPHPGPVLHIVDEWGVPPERVLMVGDYLYDIQCGSSAGTRTCFFLNPGKSDYGNEADFTVSSMQELRSMVLPPR